MRNQISTFLSIYGDSDPTEIDLWEAALEPVGGDLTQALAAWLRCKDHKPMPVDIVRIMQEHAQPEGMANIAHDIALKHGVSYKDMRGSKRTQHQVKSRYEAMYVMRQAGFSVSEIGRFFNRDHTTVMHGLNVHKARKARIAPADRLSLVSAAR